MFVFAVLALAAAIPPGNPDPRIGSWKLVSAQSALDPPNKLSITPVPNGVHLVMSGEVHLDFTARSDGHGTAVAGNPAFNQIELHRISKRQSEVKEEKDGAPVATVREKLSNDDKELTITTATGTPDRPDQITVWTRSGGAAVGKDLFAGEWTQDQSKTRMRQGLVLKIDPDGSDGIRFSGGYSFIGRFDGKQYDLRNSPNDTVQLTLVDAHTVDAVYRRDDQISQRDRWVVSADGRTLTLISQGTLQTGQRVSENLVFQKQ